MHKNAGIHKTFLVCLVLFSSISLLSCMADSPDSELIEVSKQLAKQSKQKSSGIGRDASDIKLSDRPYTYVNLSEEKNKGRNPPYYLDLDIADDTAEIWTQADLDCPGCDPQTKKERAQKWDLKINGRDISLNTNLTSKATGNTLQAIAATTIYSPLNVFSESINRDAFPFKPQTTDIQPKVLAEQLVRGTGSFGASFLLRTTKGNRIIYFELVNANVAPNWVLFNMREQVLGRDSQFTPSRPIYLKWGRDALGKGGIMDVDDTGIMRVYFDFDACYTAGRNLCFSGDASRPLGPNVVNSKPMNNWDLYFSIRVGTWDNGAMILNGGGSRDIQRNNEYDAAALFLGQIAPEKRNGRTDQQPLDRLWGFSSFEQYKRMAANSNKYEQVTLGSGGNNAFYWDGWYDVILNNQGQAQAVPNNRIYMLETTEREGLAFQITKTDAQANIMQLAYRGAKVKQRRKFNIKFRQPNKAKIKLDLSKKTYGKKAYLFALDEEIVDSITGKPLAKDEFELIKYTIRRLDSSKVSGLKAELKQVTLDAEQAKLMTRIVNGKPLKTRKGTRMGVYAGSSGSCKAGEPDQAPEEILEIKARLPGSNRLHTWQVTSKQCTAL